LEKLDGIADPMTSPIAVFESVLAIARKTVSNLREARRDLADFMIEAGITVINLDQRDGEAAIEAFSRFGKGHHRAQLNMGDCFAYACAKCRGVPLLCKGDDFIHTDIARA
jgi:ribonuclease VapC